MTHKLGLHWMRLHGHGSDFEHIERMQYKSVKPFQWMWRDQNFCAALLAILPNDAIILARDHPLSEQHAAMLQNPEATGKRHADEWMAKVKSNRYHLPTDRSFFLGLNEPDTNNHRGEISRYTVAYLTRLREHGLRGAAWSFGTGHPRTVDGTPDTKPDWDYFAADHRAIVEGNHLAVVHIYGTKDVPLAPGHYSRLQSCPWQDIHFVIGECGIDQHVIGGGPHIGWQGVGITPEQYAAWFDQLILGVNDPRIHSWMPFTYDFSRPWDSFDVRPAARAFESFDWQHAKRPPAPAPTPTEKFVWPLQGRISQWWGQRPEYYAKYGAPGHNGLDIAAPQGKPVFAMADGQVAWSDTDPGYGEYVRVWHPELRVHSFYAHLYRRGVGWGNTVRAGDVVGLCGSTGDSTGSHLHFEIRIADKDGRYTDARNGHSRGRIDPLSAWAIWERC